MLLKFVRLNIGSTLIVCVYGQFPAAQSSLVLHFGAKIEQRVSISWGNWNSRDKEDRRNDESFVNRDGEAAFQFLIANNNSPLCLSNN